MNKICVIGTWHLGCVVSACLSEMDHEVRGVDFDHGIISNLQKGIPPLFEPGLEALIKKNMKKRRLSFHHDFQTALKDVQAIFIAFDTPVNDRDCSDLKPIYDACEKIAKHASHEKILIVVSSQVPVGTCRKLKSFMTAKNVRLEPDVVCNPENLRLGKAIDTFLSPDRIVIGAETKETAQKLVQLYDKINSPKLVMSLESAEFVKHALNSYLAMSISFINEIADLCENSSADIRDVVRALKSDGRIGQQAFLSPGLGFAGGTLARDLQVLIQTGKEKRIQTKIVQAALDVNRKRTKTVLKKIQKSFAKLKGLRGGIMGLTYKPGTSTLRRSIAIELAKQMTEKGIKIKAYDPMVRDFKENGTALRRIRLCKNAYDVAKGSEFLVIATEWPEFRKLDFPRIRSLMRNKNSNSHRPVLIDTKNLLNPEMLVQEGFEYLGTGVNLK